MRKLVIATVVAAGLATVFAAPASAAFDPHFDVISKQTSGRGGPSGFVFTEKLLDPGNLKDKVGSDRGVCKPVVGTRTAFCRGIFFLGGEIGGHGTIRVSGKIGAGDNRLNVNGGSGAFEGVAGKVLVSDPDLGPGYGLNHFDLVR